MTRFPGADALGVFRDGEDLSGDLVAQYPGIGHQGVGSPVRADVAAADAHGPHPDQRLAGAGLGRRKVYHLHLPGFFHVYAFHAVTSYKFRMVSQTDSLTGMPFARLSRRFRVSDSLG